MELTERSPLTALRGIGEKKSGLFGGLGVHTVGDLLALLPRRYEERGKIELLKDCGDGEAHAVEVVCTAPPVLGRTYGGVDTVRMQASDASAPVIVTFFGKKYLMPLLRTGRRYRLYGRVMMGLYGAEMNTPELEPIVPGRPLPAVVPVYPLCAGLTQNAVRAAVESALPVCDTMEDPLPEALRASYGLLPRGEAARLLHRPDRTEELDAARRTAAFAELLIFQLALRGMRRAKDGARAFPMQAFSGESFLSRLPFALTGAQKRVVSEVFSDLGKDVPMTRLVQGDVGSGKTVVAAAAIELCVRNGRQAVLLAPTELLAEQHFAKLDKLFSPLGIRTVLLTAAVPKKRKELIRQEIAEGRAQLVVGTHAVLQEDVSFSALGLVVTDEQHRFGVRQRALLLDRSERGTGGVRSHMLVMSATPIPRSLSLILYGDLDVSLLDELPPGRKPIKTLVMKPEDRGRVYASIRRQISLGGQAYVVCPLVEENAESPKKAAEAYFLELQSGAFAGIPMGLVHGRMTPAAKNAAMRDFAEGKTRILVSTTVIEVGVDVPDANVILIENAEFFGLSQLHQLRGRVGRGERESFCVLINGSGKPNERLETMKETSDGFRIAEADLEQRGPGDFFGEKQSGELVLHTASLTDMPLIAETRKALEDVLPRLREPEYRLLREEALRMVREAGNGKTIN